MRRAVLFDRSTVSSIVTRLQALNYADITNPQSLNKYQYSYNNPPRYLDLDGHQSETPEKKQKKTIDSTGEAILKALAAAPFGGLSGIAFSLLIDPPMVYAPAEGESIVSNTVGEVLQAETTGVIINLVIPKMGKLVRSALIQEIGDAAEKALAKLVGGERRVSIPVSDTERHVVDVLD